MDALFGVEKSLNSLFWAQKQTPEDLVSAIARRNDLPLAVARVLASRGLEPDQVPVFLNPTFKTLLPDPYTLKDMQKAAERIAKAIADKEKIAIFGDYDVDGATSSCVLSQYLNMVCDNEVVVRIPERDEGYGPTKEAMGAFVESGATLIVTVDCGTTAFEAFDPFKNAADIVVVDHHEPDISLPDVHAVVNPKRLDEPADCPCREMAAVGVVFLLVVALNRLLREQGYFTKDRPEPDIRKLLDLVALGTVCDVMKLRGVNRLFVKSGLHYIGARSNNGICALSDKLGLKKSPTSYDIGFSFGPRLNAAGRIGKSDLGYRLLSSKTPAEAKALADKLDELNGMRRDMCAQAFVEAIEMVEKNEPKPFVFVCGKDWHAGIIGIIAGKLKDRYNMPALVMAHDKDMIHGSARSVSKLNIGEAVMAGVERGVLERGGGHAMAAGFSLKAENLREFEDFLTEYVRLHTSSNDLTDNIYWVDGILDLGAVSADFVEKMTCLEPFGEGNPEPRFAVPNVAVSYARLLKFGNIACTLKNLSGQTIRAIAFRAADTLLGQKLLASKGELMHMTGCVREDLYSGKGQAQFVIEDAAFAR